MRSIRTLEEAREISAVRLTNKRRFARVGDLFRLSPYPGVVLWGRLIKKASFFGHNFQSNLVYVYDVVSRERPEPELLLPSNLIIGPTLVNNLGWVRGYWEIIASEPLRAADKRDRHLFVRYRGSGSRDDYQLIDESGHLVVDGSVDLSTLGQSGYGNFNSIDWMVRGVLEERGVIPR
jgi:hypothetical protein